MSAHKPELMSALLDGELKGFRRALALRHVRNCPLCAAEYRHLRHVHKLLRANPPQIAMSDSPEFFWSKVKREIEQHRDEPVEVPAPRLSLGDWLSQHQAAMVVATAILIVGLSALWALQAGKSSFNTAFHKEKGPAQVLVVQTPDERLLPHGGVVAERLAKVESVSTAVPNAVATALESADSDVTVIWVSGLPWTSDMTEMKTEYANLDT
jgi:anti-sigma factor RsiW